MSKERFVIVSACTIKDKSNNDYLEIEECCDILNIYCQQIAELEEKLSSAIIPKFKMGQKVWSIFESQYFRDYKELCNLEITAIMKTNKGIFYQGYVLEKGKNRSDYWFNEEKTFLTKEEAQTKFEELKNE